jgi:hypothetical protein
MRLPSLSTNADGFPIELYSKRVAPPAASISAIRRFRASYWRRVASVTTLPPSAVRVVVSVRRLPLASVVNVVVLPNASVKLVRRPNASYVKCVTRPIGSVELVRFPCVSYAYCVACPSASVTEI